MKQKWVVFSYSLPAARKSSTRVGIWRRLQRLGAVTPVNGMYLLPAIERCVEAFQWLAQEVIQADGQAVVMFVQNFDQLEPQAIIALFQAARQKEYAELDAQALTIEEALSGEPDDKLLGRTQDDLGKLQRRYREIADIDYFDSLERTQVQARLQNIRRLLLPEHSPPPEIAPVTRKDYQNRSWVTRPQPHVDRLACIWLIRRFIDKHAEIRFAKRAGPNEVAFDMDEAAGGFGHVGNLCTFETMLRAFELKEPGLATVAELVHQIDLDDQRYMHPEAVGIDTVLRGWLLEELADQELAQRGQALFDGLLRTVAARVEQLHYKDPLNEP